jgi:hypothetical protein
MLLGLSKLVGNPVIGLGDASRPDAPVARHRRVRSRIDGVRALSLHNRCVRYADMAIGDVKALPFNVV